MLIKVGTDITVINRIDNLLKKYGDKFLNRVFTKEEILKSKNSKGMINSSTLAKRFAGKEAVVKAVGSGFNQLISLQDISIINDVNNKPIVILSDKALKYVCNKFNINNFNVEISLSDDGGFAIAIVVIYV